MFRGHQEASGGGAHPVYQATHTSSNTVTFQVTADGTMTNSGQPAFLVQPASNQLNFAENTAVTVVWGTERFDQDNNFATPNFTAPVTGKYQFTANIYFIGPQEAYNYLEVAIVTSNRPFYSIVDSGTWDQDSAYHSLQVTVLADMDVSDTAYVTVQQNGTAGDASADVWTGSYFCGHLVCCLLYTSDAADE